MVVGVMIGVFGILGMIYFISQASRTLYEFHGPFCERYCANECKRLTVFLVLSIQAILIGTLLILIRRSENSLATQPMRAEVKTAFDFSMTSLILFVLSIGLLSPLCLILSIAGLKKGNAAKKAGNIDSACGTVFVISRLGMWLSIGSLILVAGSFCLLSPMPPSPPAYGAMPIPAARNATPRLLEGLEER